MKNLKKLRKEKGLTQEKLAEKLHVSTSSIANYESGLNYPEMEFLIYMASYFRVSTDYLLDLTDIPYRLEEAAEYRLTNRETKIMEMLYAIPEPDRDRYLTVLEKVIDLYDNNKDRG